MIIHVRYHRSNYCSDPKEARRQNEEREKDSKEYIREQGNNSKKIAHAVHDHKEQNIKTTREIAERYREQIQSLKTRS